MSGRLLRTATLFLAVVAIGVSAVWLWGRHLPLGNAAGDPPLGESGRYPADPLALAELPGAPENYTSIDDLDGIAALRVLTDDELATLFRAGPGRAKVAVSNYVGGKATVVLLRVADARAAGTAADRLAALQLGYGFRPIPAPDAVSAALLDPKPDALPGGRAHYVHGDIVVRVEFRSPDPHSAHREFGRLLRQQLEALPAHVR